MSRSALKANKSMYALVRRIDVNTRAIAKLASATDWLQGNSEDASLLAVPMFDLIQERRNMRLALEAKLRKERE